jgi:hypothetical protein
MTVDRVKFQEIVSSQLPRYVREDFPLLVEFLEQYYVSQEYQGGTYDIINNIDKYVKVDELFNLKNSTTLSSDVSFVDTTIHVSSTEGFNDRDGIIKINDEIIYYKSKNSTSFLECYRGFSGITNYITPGSPDELTFSSSEVDSHVSGTVVYNLNILFLQEFFKKLKKQIVPGFSERSLFSDLNQKNFIFNSNSFYTSKGTEQSYEILFRALYGEDVELIRPSQYLLTPSNADYKVTKDFIVEELQGDPKQLKNLTIFQKLTGARGSVTDVEVIPYDNYQYYKISIDSGYSRDVNVSGSIYGEFKPNPQTKILNDVSVGSTIIDVDSTIGFPPFGNLVTKDVDENEVGIAYSGKTLTQFFNVSGNLSTIKKKTNISLDSYSYAYVGIDTTNQIRVRFTASLKEFETYDNNYYYKKGDTIQLKSLGYEAKGKKSNNWSLNVKTRWNVKTLTVLDSNIFSYRLEFYNSHFLQEGYKVLLENVEGSFSYIGTVIRVPTSTEVIVNFSQSVNSNQEYYIVNQTLKGNSSKYPYLQYYIANVENTFAKFNSDVMIASNSIPYYYNSQTNPYDKTVVFSGSYTSTDELILPINSTTLKDHGFYTGDSVNLQINGEGFEDITSGAYFVTRVDERKIKLSRSYVDLSRGTYLIFNGSVTDAVITYLDFYRKDIEPQGIYRQILQPINDDKDHVTNSGHIGIFVNGVELLNYKSQNSVYYGDIIDFTITSSGENYDVINPPVLNINDMQGSGAEGVCNVLGELKRLEVIDTGLGYYSKPSIKISGGNGSGAKAEPRLTSIKYSLPFLANGQLDQVNLTDNIISFSDDHKLLDGERVIYEPRLNTVVGGLTTEAQYFIQIAGEKEIKLHNTESDALAGINTVNLTSYGNGTQYIVAAELKQIVSSVVVTDPGQGYENKRKTIPQAGINTALNQVNIKNHGYQSKEIVKYTEGQTPVPGLSETKDYYVIKVDDDNFSISEVGVGTIPRDYYYDNGIIINFSDGGNGSFNYPPITVEVEGPSATYDKFFVEDFQELYIIESPINENIITPVQILAWTDTEAQINSPGNQNEYYVLVSLDTNWLISDEPFIGNIRQYKAVLQPIFRGGIQSIDLVDGGVGYGSSEIIGFRRQPDLVFSSGSGAKITPIINNGQISDIIINSSGSGYNCPPDLEIISDTGNFASLTPIVVNGRLTEVKIIKGGAGYVSGKTNINVISAGQGVRTNINVRGWNVNLFERNFSNFLEDDGIIQENISNESLQYSHLYLPRLLRESLYSIEGFEEDNIKYGIFDLTLDESGIEQTNRYHSPIVGWAYDGNPIYGPYGFSNIDGTGFIKRMESGYKLKETFSNRPSYDIFPNGFFTDDYEFTGAGDLDIHNGRFCVTPDYPNGVYAYFCTIDDDIDSGGPFDKLRRPSFPYVIGDSFKSRPIDFNFKSSSNQSDYDIESEGWLRNTNNYYTNGGNSGYDYIFNSNTQRNQSIDITATTQGTVDSIQILDPGSNYRVNDRVIFDETGTDGRNADWKVSKVNGKEVTSVSLATTVFNDVTFVSDRSTNGFIGYSSIPHDFLPNDIIYVNGLSNNFKNFEAAYSVGINSNRWTLSLGVNPTTTTGIVTYFYVNGSLDESFIRENDVLQLPNERVKVLNIDRVSNRIRVLRNQDNTIGSSHSSGTLVQEDPRKLSFTSGSITTSRILPNNREFYFNPAEQIGLGTASGTGLGTTITFSNPGVGITQIIIEPQHIYIPNHNLTLNTPLTYKVNGGQSINVWSGIQSSPIFPINDNSDIFAVPLSKDFIGIATNKVGLSSEGVYVGINTTAGILYFQSVGVGDTHSFTTNIPGTLTGRVSKNVVTVSTAETHGLSPNDIVYFDLNPLETIEISVIYNDYNRRIVFDPDVITSSGINSISHTIQVPSNKYELGDKVLYTSDYSGDVLISNQMYYVVPFLDDKIKLVQYPSEISKNSPNFVRVGLADTGTIARINPQIKVQKNNNLKFNLSDSSLGFINSLNEFSAFEMKIYTDRQFKNEFNIAEGSSVFEVSRSGRIGIDSTAYLNIKISDNIPKNLYYKFVPDNLDIIPAIKEEIVQDTTVYQHSQINVTPNKFDGTHRVSKVTSKTFDFNIPFNKDSTNLYDKTNSNISYQTSSRSAFGGIGDLTYVNKGIGYKSLPGFSSVRSSSGTGALLEPSSTTIGKILNYKFNNIGYGYPSDLTLSGVGNLPEILKIDPLATFESIGISSAGVNYFVAPDLVVVDGLTNKQITDVDIKYELGDNQVTILKNTISINNDPPNIIPINNPNGFSISLVTYSTTSNLVRLYLNKQFSDPEDFPFGVGGKIIVENISIGLNTTGTGYNSEDYEYTLFDITAVDSQLGGSGAYVEYDLSDYLEVGDYPGNIQTVTGAYVTPENYFPIFDVKLTVKDFFEGERVSNGEATGIVERWDPVSKYLFISSKKEFNVGTTIISESSNVKSNIKSKINFESTIRTGAGATFVSGWQSISGFLNNNLQVIPNNEYYQKFSYSLKSRVDYDTWNDPVSTLNHTAGFEKFADLIIENEVVGISTALDIDLETVVDLIGEISINCFPDFDNGSENIFYINNNKVVSDEIVFQNRILTDYFESKGNRVLEIDNIDSQFNSNPRSTRFSFVGDYDLKYTFNKILTLVQDSELRDRKQFSIVSVLQDNNQAYTNQYATIDTIRPLGYFDVGFGTSNWSLSWYPREFEYNNYDVSQFSFSILDNISGIGTLDLGDVVNVSTAHTNVSVVTTTNIVSISSTYRAAKLLIQFEDENNNYYANELNIVHNDTDVTVLQYGDITNNTSLSGLAGFGTYSSYLDSGQLKVDFIPTVGTAVTANINIVAISTSGFSGVSTSNMLVTDLSSYTKSITASGTPVPNVIASYTNPFTSEYLIICVEDVTNNEFELFEMVTLDNVFEENLVEYAKVNTGSIGLGTVGLTSTSSEINITYTPIAGIDVEVRAFGVSLKNFDNTVGISSIDLNNNILLSRRGNYTGTEFDKRTSFDLKHNEKLIFERIFEGNNGSVVNLSSNTILLPDHYFVTGEKVVYSYENSNIDSTNAIGIATTTVSGVSTDKLPTELYVIKYSESLIGLAKSATDALLTNPIDLDFESLGIGTFHKITSTNQNARALIAIDNMIQAPITEVNIETELSSNIVFDPTFTVTSITSFKSNDLIKIDDEIMLIQNIGVGATNNFKVLRAQMGSEVDSHGIGSTVKRLGGNYNIVDSTIYFASAPYGLTPIGTTTGSPDERDWIGITTSSTFQGRTFMRSGIKDSSEHTYQDNYTFDNIQSQFNGVDNEFTLTSEGNNVVGFATNQAIILNSNILQEPQGAQATTGDITLFESAGISSIRYLGESTSSLDDPNRATVPRGGTIVSVASTQGFGYQPTVSAGASVFVSVAGTITSISIGNSGSGYRSAVQPIVNVGIVTSTVGLGTVEFIGTAAVQNGHIVSIALTNYSSNLDYNNPPVVVIDAPLPYSNIPLVYSSESTVGQGTGGRVDITVGQGSSIINFELNTPAGYSYGEGEILTVAIGGTSGIPTDTSKSFREFQLTVDEIYLDTFNGWTVGELDVFDKLDDQFDGEKTKFTLKIVNEIASIITSPGSLIDLEMGLLVFINDILQIPGLSYKFNGGSVIEFTEPPKLGDSSKIIFYRGTPEVDVVFNDILETVKIGDSLQLKNNASAGQNISFLEDPRVVTGITTLDTVKTFTYSGPGIKTDENLARPIEWCKQLNDIVIDGSFITKDRVEYEPSIYPAAYLIANIGVNSTNAYFDSIRPLFDSENETTLLDYQFDVTLTDQSEIVGASVTSTVGSGGSISSITVLNGGSGYSNLTNPTISIAYPGTDNSGRATATATVSGDEVVSISIGNTGIGYTVSPQILVETPSIRREQVAVSSYFGDQGYIVGYAQSSSSLATLEVYIPENSFLRDSIIAGTAITMSQLSNDDWFVVNNSNIGLSTSNFDGIYQVQKSYGISTDLSSIGVGVTMVVRLEINTSIGTTDNTFRNERIYGEYSWGKVIFSNRELSEAKEFIANSYSGLSTSPILTRTRPLRYNNYTD